jgi:hypothetical protein
MSSTETQSAPAEPAIALSDSTLLNSTLAAITSADLPFEVAHDLWSYVVSLKRYHYPASALRELPELLAAITDAVALALSSAAATGQTSPSAKASPSATSAPAGAAHDGETGALRQRIDELEAELKGSILLYQDAVDDLENVRKQRDSL